MGASDKPDAAVDARAYWLLVLMGAGLLTPWNVMLNSLPFFATLYDKATFSTFPFYVSAVYGWPGIPVLFAMVFYGDRLPLALRICGTFLAQAAIMALMPALAPLSYLLPLALMFVNGVCTGLLQSSLFGLTAAFPPAYSQGALLGQGLAGALSSFAQLVVMGAAAAEPGRDNSAPAAYGYFACAALVMAACAAAYLALVRLPVARAGGRKLDSGVEEVASTAQDHCRRELLLLLLLARGAHERNRPGDGLDRACLRAGVAVVAAGEVNIYRKVRLGNARRGSARHGACGAAANAANATNANAKANVAATVQRGELQRVGQVARLCGQQPRHGRRGDLGREAAPGAVPRGACRVVRRDVRGQAVARRRRAHDFSERRRTRGRSGAIGEI